MKTVLNISLAACCLLPITVFAEQLPYTLAFSENPPFSMTKDAKPTGIATDIMVKLFQQAKLPYQFLEVPLARAMVNAKVTANYCVFPVQRSQAIEAEYQWISPILITRSGLFVRPDSGLSFITLSDAKKMTIGVLRGSGDAEYLKSFGFSVEEANSQEQNLEKLFAKRFDVWATDVLSANFFIRKSASKDKAPKEALTFRESLGSVACNLRMAKADAAKLQQALDAMVKAGGLR